MSEPATIELSAAEMILAGQLGIMRRVSSLKQGIGNKKHSDQSDLEIDVDGAMAEMAFAKYLGIYFLPTINTFKNADVDHWHVRQTRHENGGLIVRRRDPDGHYVLIVSNPPLFRIVGWLDAAEARAECFIWRDAWKVPQEQLKELLAA